MGLFTKKTGQDGSEENVFHFPTSKRLLMIFTKNPVLGKCKTRLAKDIGDRRALAIYRFLLEHTKKITQDLPMDKWVFYSDEIWEDDLWDQEHYHKRLQKGYDLGQKMYHAFEEAFAHGYEKVLIIGCDIYEMQSRDILEGFALLSTHNFVIGPASDGGYYLLGMTTLRRDLFENKNWGTPSVLADTLSNLREDYWVLLEERNDVDTLDDIRDHPDFQPFFKNFNQC